MQDSDEENELERLGYDSFYNVNGSQKILEMTNVYS